MGKPEIRPLTIHKWLNRSSLKLAWITISGSPTNMHFIIFRSGIFDPRIGEFVFTRLLFFVFGFFRQASAEIVAPILTLNTSNGVILRKSVPSGGPVNEARYLGGQIPKHRSKMGVNRQFPAKSQKSLNFDIFKTSEPIRTKFCRVINTTKNTLRVVPRMRTTILDHPRCPSCWVLCYLPMA